VQLTGREVLGFDDAAGEVERKKDSISLLSVLRGLLDLRSV
jgi:hypothetical protein